MFTFDNRLSFTQSALCGAVSGITARTLSAPFDVAKVTAQVGLQNHVGRQSYTYMKQLYQREGWRAWFKGNGTACVKIAPYSTIQFIMFHQLKSALSNHHGRISEMEAVGAGAFAGCTATALTYPMDTVKTRLIVQPYDKEKAVYKGIVHALQTIKAQEGYRGLFRGLFTTLTATVPYVAANFSTYEFLCNQLDLPGHCVTATESLVRGVIASCVAVTAAFPFDIIRRKIQASSKFLPNGGGVDLMFKNARSCFMAIIRNHGLKGLFRGIVPALIRVTPYNSFMFLSYEACKRACFEFNEMVHPPNEPHYSDDDTTEMAEILRTEYRKQLQNEFYLLPPEVRKAQAEAFKRMLKEAIHQTEEEERLVAEMAVRKGNQDGREGKKKC